MAKKDNVIRRVEDINEKELLAALAGFGEDEVKKPPEPVAVKETEEEERGETGKKPAEQKKRKQENNYTSVFLKPKELKSRQSVYISGELHEKIIAIIKEIAVKGMTVGAFIDTVLWQHLEEHKDEINNLYRRKRDDLL